MIAQCSAFRNKREHTTISLCINVAHRNHFACDSCAEMANGNDIASNPASPNTDLKREIAEQINGKNNKLCGGNESIYRFKVAVKSYERANARRSLFAIVIPHPTSGANLHKI